MSQPFPYAQHCAFERALAFSLGHFHLCGESLVWRAWRLENLRLMLEHPKIPLGDADRIGLGIAIDGAALLLALTRPANAIEWRLKHGILAEFQSACPEHHALRAMIDAALALEGDAQDEPSSPITPETLN